MLWKAFQATLRVRLRPQTALRAAARGVKMSSTTNSALFKQLSGLPLYRAAQFQSEHVIRATVAALDYDRKLKRQTYKTFFIAPGSVSSTHSQDSPEIVASRISPSGKYLANLREVSEPSGKRRFVEVWSGDKLEACVEVTQTHGSFYTDEYLSSISFSPSEGKLVYTAEANPPEDSEIDPFAKYRFIPEFGESYSGKKKPAIFFVDWAGRDNGGPKSAAIQLQLSDTAQSPILLGHPIFASESKVLAIGYEYAQDGRILGVIHCPNRTAGIWDLSLPDLSQNNTDDKTVHCSGVKLTHPSRSCRSPRVIHRKDRSDLLVWISNSVGGPHASCATMHIRDLATGEERILVEPVWEPEGPNSSFPGLYITTLPSNPFIELSSPSSSQALHYIAVTSIWRSRSTVVLISLNDGKVTELTPDEDSQHFSWTLLCTDDKRQLVCMRSAPCRPPELVLGNIDSSGRVKWDVIAQPDLSRDLREKLDTVSTSTIPVPERHPTEIIVVRSGDAASAPCITLPHGGPHSTMTTAFNAWVTTFALDGYTVAMPNYTGSLGFGEKYVRKLLGRIGSLDVEDCQASIEHLVSSGLATFGPGQQFLSGGSHGGFLLGHLIGQLPGTFSGAVLRNPVISMGEISTSDIPDWYFEEVGLTYGPPSLVTPSVYEKLYRMSPIAYVDKVDAPVIILVGEKDQRVAPTQGRNYYHALKARGKDVQMFCLKEDIHALDSVEGQWVSYEVSKRLFDSQKAKAIKAASS